MQQPRKRDLSWCAVLARSDFFDRFDQRKIAVEVFALKTRDIHPAPIAFCKFIGAFGDAGQEAATERAVRH
jgi:hypothetical protein